MSDPFLGRSTRYRSLPWQLTCAVCSVGAVALLGMATFVATTSAAVAVRAAWDIVVVAIAAALIRAAFAVLRISDQEIRVVNTFSSYRFTPEQVKEFTFSGSFHPTNIRNMFLLGDDRHVVLVTVEDHPVNVGALTLGRTSWGRSDVERIVRSLNESLDDVRTGRRPGLL